MIQGTLPPAGPTAQADSAAVSNHLQAESLRACYWDSDLLGSPGGTSILLDRRWAKATPAVKGELGARLDVPRSRAADEATRSCTPSPRKACGTRSTYPSTKPSPTCPLTPSWRHSTQLADSSSPPPWLTTQHSPDAHACAEAWSQDAPLARAEGSVRGRLEKAAVAATALPSLGRGLVIALEVAGASQDLEAHR